MNKSIFLLFIFLLILYCSKATGTFAFKNSNDDRYIIKDELCEFNHDEKIDWSFCFAKLSKQKKIGVVILKKEKVWIDIYSFYDNVSKNKPCIYGNIQNYEEGRYKIVIVDSGNTIAEKEFVIYNENNE
ncbi:MAG: hypothetical protein N3F66_02195 [Spirochaetes bacterium]|nr:hypothetical protein [Spirochaetota bacterium]